MRIEDIKAEIELLKGSKDQKETTLSTLRSTRVDSL